MTHARLKSATDVLAWTRYVQMSARRVVAGVVEDAVEEEGAVVSTTIAVTAIEPGIVAGG